MYFFANIQISEPYTLKANRAWRSGKISFQFWSITDNGDGDGNGWISIMESTSSIWWISNGQKAISSDIWDVISAEWLFPWFMWEWCSLHLDGITKIAECIRPTTITAVLSKIATIFRDGGPSTLQLPWRRRWWINRHWSGCSGISRIFAKRLIHSLNACYRPMWRR